MRHEALIFLRQNSVPSKVKVRFGQLSMICFISMSRLTVIVLGVISFCLFSAFGGFDPATPARLYSLRGV